MNERRQSERHPVRSVTVNIKTHGLFSKEVVESADVVDVSDRGLGIKSPEPVEENATFRFGFYLKWLKKTCYVVGVVMHCNQLEGGGYQLGVKVTEDKDLTLSFIRTAMEEKAHQEDSQEISKPQASDESSDSSEASGE